jgi:cell division septal protein FtsQ
MSKILSLALMLALVIGLTFLTFFGNKEKRKEVISSVSIKNFYMLSESDYLKFAKLDPSSSMANLTLPIIKDRIEKHPYVLRSEVELTAGNKVNIIVYEKKINAIVQKGAETYFITNKYEALPIFANTNLMNVPLITFPKGAENIKALCKYNDDSMKEAFRIIDGIKNIDYDLYKGLEQINLRNGADIVLSFNCFNAPVIFGRGDDARKVVYLESLFKNYNNQQLDSINYIDLRYSKLIYVGKMNG